MQIKLPEAHDVVVAHDRIREWIRETPIIALKGPGARPMALKLENLQRSGSFKLRGALNKLLALGPAARGGVITASGGNHGLGVAWAGQLLGVPVHAVVPTSSPMLKRKALVAAGANIRLVDGQYPEAEGAARDLARVQGLPFVHPYDDADVIAGQGTVIREFIAQVPQIQTIVVAVGGGGLAAGAVLAAEGRRVVGVEPRGARTMHAALAVGRPVTLESIETIAADALGAGRVGEVTFAVCQKGLNRVELVHDDTLRAAQRWLWEQARTVVEPGAAIGLAALTNGQLDDDPGPVGIVLCGANVDPRTLPLD
ncbi:MAG: pyridoxal-phosphate dependent enzyme [Myxococcales bacterium]|nr:pyridoxal-phosphate dependent enzyme [Myxococcales bacterium]